MPLDPAVFAPYDEQFGYPHEPGQVIYITEGRYKGHTATVKILWLAMDEYALAVRLDDGRDVQLLPGLGDIWGVTRPDGATVGPVDDHRYPRRPWR